MYHLERNRVFISDNAQVIVSHSYCFTITLGSHLKRSGKTDCVKCFTCGEKMTTTIEHAYFECKSLLKLRDMSLQWFKSSLHQINVSLMWHSQFSSFSVLVFELFFSVVLLFFLPFGLLPYISLVSLHTLFWYVFLVIHSHTLLLAKSSCVGQVTSL